MHLVYEILPVFLFFIAFKWYGIYIATVVGIIATFIQAVGNRLYTGQWDKKQVITFAVFLGFGSLTLYFHDPIFVKWKPTVIFWIFALTILFTQIFTKKPLMQRLMENVVDGKGSVPNRVWTRINVLWASFFLLLGFVNIYIAYNYSNEAWVNFKFYGITSALIVISVIQAFYLTSYLHDERK